MKKITLLLIVLITANVSFSQVTLDAEYDEDFALIELAKAGNKIVVIDLGNIYGDLGFPDPDSPVVNEPTNTIVTVYNLDNSLYKTIDIGNQGRVVHISQNIINTDDKLELIISEISDNANASSFNNTYIINEDLEELFRVNGFAIHEDALIEDKFLYDTTEGLKLSLSGNDENGNEKVRIYSLGGDATLSSKTEVSPLELAKVYPNPSSDIVNIPYIALNNEIVIITVYNMNGSLIETKEVDDQFTELKLNISNYSQGAYLYKIKNSLGTYTGKFLKK